jgi:hypothetical protein
MYGDPERSQSHMRKFRTTFRVASTPSGSSYPIRLRGVPCQVLR